MRSVIQGDPGFTRRRLAILLAAAVVLVGSSIFVVVERYRRARAKWDCAFLEAEACAIYGDHEVGTYIVDYYLKNADPCVARSDALAFRQELDQRRREYEEAQALSEKAVALARSGSIEEALALLRPLLTDAKYVESRRSVLTAKLLITAEPANEDDASAIALIGELLSLPYTPALSDGSLACPVEQSDRYAREIGRLADRGAIKLLLDIYEANFDVRYLRQRDYNLGSRLALRVYICFQRIVRQEVAAAMLRDRVAAADGAALRLVLLELAVAFRPDLRIAVYAEIVDDYRKTYTYDTEPVEPHFVRRKVWSYPISYGAYHHIRAALDVKY